MADYLYAHDIIPHPGAGPSTSAIDAKPQSSSLKPSISDEHKPTIYMDVDLSEDDDASVLDPEERAILERMKVRLDSIYSSVIYVE